MNSDDEAVIAFDLIVGAWLMRFEDGWYAYREDGLLDRPVREQGRSCTSRFEGSEVTLASWVKDTETPTDAARSPSAP